jgi:paraquat-inducible protein A
VLYRAVEQIGRWSMLDVFVLTLLIALVQLGNLMTIEVGRAGTFFASVVVLTILAAKSFDPRLIWDAMEERA